MLLVEQRLDAVLEVLGGASVTDVARRYGGSVVEAAFVPASDAGIGGGSGD